MTRIISEPDSILDEVYGGSGELLCTEENNSGAEDPRVICSPDYLSSNGSRMVIYFKATLWNLMDAVILSCI